MDEKAKKQTHSPSPGSPSVSPPSPAKARGAPRWTIAFLRALERLGEVEAAARDAGVDKSTAYARRRAHPDFAKGWEEALRVRSGRAEAQVQERVGFWERVKGKVSPKLLGSSVAAPSPGSPAASPTSPSEGRGTQKEELLASSSLGGKRVRAGPGRWNQEREKIFFDELAATANVSRAAEAAGISKNAIYARRMKRPDFRSKWDAVLETARSAIEMHLVEAAKKSFDPDDLDVETIEPKVSVAEAIRIAQLHGSKAQRSEIEEVEPGEEEIEAARKRLFDKLQKLRMREMTRMLSEGWSHDEEHDHMVPPGWVRGPDCAASGPGSG